MLDQPSRSNTLAENVTISTALVALAADLSSAGIESADVEADLIMADVLGKTRGQLAVDAVLGKTITAEQLTNAQEMLRRRQHREPLQHILGYAAFRQLELLVGDGVFVPRPETETLVQHGLDYLADRFADAANAAGPRVVDFGTGSGAIALSIAKEFPSASVYAVEISPEAFVWASKNFEKQNLPNVTLLQGDIATAFTNEDGTFDAIVSNPPYIPLGMIPRDPEVRKFDPEMALFSGEDGLDAVRQLAERARELLAPAGLLIIEHGELQGEAIRTIFTSYGLVDVETLQDLTERDRYTRAIMPSSQPPSTKLEDYVDDL